MGAAKRGDPIWGGGTARHVAGAGEMYFPVDDNYNGHDEKHKDGWRRAWHTAKSLLNATDVDFVVHGDRGGIRLITERARHFAKMYRRVHYIGGYENIIFVDTEGTIGFVQSAYHDGLTVLLAENWKDTPDV